MNYLTKTQFIRFSPVVLLAALGVKAQLFYVERSCGEAGSFVEIPRASKDALLDDLGLVRKKAHRQLIVSDTNNSLMAKLQTLYLNPASLRFPAADLFEHFASLNRKSDAIRVSKWLSPSWTAQVLNLVEKRRKVDSVGIFDMKEPGPGTRKIIFYRWYELLAAANGGYDVLESSPVESPLNHRQFHASGVPNLRLMSLSSMSNHLIPIASEVGGNQALEGRFGPAKGQVAFNPPEPDYFFKGSTITSVGRYLLFLVLRPTSRIRAVVDFTATLNADGESRIPAISVIGSRRLAVPACGRGSGRLFSPPLEPQIVDGQPYLMLDMGAEPSRFQNVKRGLMTLYGREVRLDRRLRVGFVRDISIISDEEYAAFVAPDKLQRFPDDLDNPNLEYSGIYEDGWTSEDAFAVLEAPSGGSFLRLQGSMPKIGEGSQNMDITLLIDGMEVATRHLTPGEFTIQYQQAPGSGKHRIEIRASAPRRLSAADRRQATFLLRYLGFDPIAPDR